MERDTMTKVERRTLFKRDGKKLWEWKVVAVSNLASGEGRDIRCMHCHGAIRIHKQQVSHGPADHAEHRSRQDSEHCKGGHYFAGEHRRSTQPVE